MRFEIVIIIVTLLVIGNIYTDGKFLKLAVSWTKYYKMIGVAIAGYSMCWLLRKNPERAKDIIDSSNEYLKYLPVDKNTSSFINPIIDITRKQNFANHPQSIIQPNSQFAPPSNQQYQQRIMNSGGKSTKRSVSETKKKFVASKQNWCCGDCKKQLPAWFEVDHTIRLENGGSNHIDNLVALCRDCHGKKTALENL
jgi:5-methylcytosine-specific restriction endonuclease McrA